MKYIVVTGGVVSGLGKGVTAYSSGEIARVIGRHSEEVEAILGYRGRPAIVHRDDMVLLR